MKKIAFQGEKGAYSEQAVFKYFKKNIKTIPCTTFDEVFSKVKNKKIEFGIIPIENFLAGSINETYDLLKKHKLFIVGEIFLRINHCLIANKNSKKSSIKKVYSHPQALAQCKDYLNKNKFQNFATPDTAGSVRYVKKQGQIDKAAIASEIAAKTHDMKILDKNIETDHNNTTRFIIISKKESQKTTNPKSSIIFTTKNIPSALYKCLGGFATNNINLTKLESRPVKGNHGSYLFYLDFEGHKNNPSVKLALKELKTFTGFIKFLGSYSKGKRD